MLVQININVPNNNNSNVNYYNPLMQLSNIVIFTIGPLP